jgi:hypothetical protein
MDNSKATCSNCSWFNPKKTSCGINSKRTYPTSVCNEHVQSKK